jgi:hypothetical protein
MLHGGFLTSSRALKGGDSFCKTATSRRARRLSCARRAREWTHRLFGLDEFYLNEAKLVSVGVDHVMGNSGRACIGGAGFETYFPGPRRFFQSQRAARQRYHDIVVGMHVMSGFSARRKAPFRDDHSLVLNLDDGCGFQYGLSMRTAIMHETRRDAVADDASARTPTYLFVAAGSGSTRSPLRGNSSRGDP